MADDLGKDWAYRMAATLVMAVRDECPHLDEKQLIESAWTELRQLHAGEGHRERFASTGHVPEVSDAIRDIGKGRKSPMRHPDAERNLRTQLQLPEKQ